MTDITSNALPSHDGTLSREFYIAAWRWHFYAGLYVAPFLVMLAVTGLIMVWSSALLGRDGEYLNSVTPASQTIPVSEQASAAVAAVSGASFMTCSPRRLRGPAS